MVYHDKYHSLYSGYQSVRGSTYYSGKSQYMDNTYFPDSSFKVYNRMLNKQAMDFYCFELPQMGHHCHHHCHNNYGQMLLGSFLLGSAVSLYDNFQNFMFGMAYSSMTNINSPCSYQGGFINPTMSYFV